MAKNPFEPNFRNLVSYDKPGSGDASTRVQQDGIANLAIILSSPIWVPLWAMFHIGERTWSHLGRFMKIVSILFLGAWIGSAVLVIVAPPLRNTNPTLFDNLKRYEGVIMVAIGALILSFAVGWLWARFRPPQPIHDSEADVDVA